MDYGFFEALTLQEADDYLDAFKHAGRARIGDEWWSRLLTEGTQPSAPTSQR